MSSPDGDYYSVAFHGTGRYREITINHLETSVKEGGDGMGFQDMVDFLDSTWKVKDQIVPCLIGEPGIGKTAACYKHAENVGAGNVVVIIASQIQPNEVSGITMPVQETHSMDIFDHFRLSSLKDGDILFFDELLEADQLVLRACLTLVESRMMMSGKKLPDIQIVAATNPSIKPPSLAENIKQRFLFKECDYSVPEVNRYIKDKTGLLLGEEFVKKILETGDGNKIKRYNNMSPRSLTKMMSWLSSCSNAKSAEYVINEIMAAYPQIAGQTLKIKLTDIWRGKETVNTVVQIADENNVTIPDDVINAGFSEIVSYLTDVGIWDSIAEDLSKIDFGDVSEKYTF